MRKPRGLTFVTVLIAIAAAAGVLWLATYGPAYWENLEVKRVLQQAGNMCYREPRDEMIKNWIINELHHLFDEKRESYGSVETVMRIDFNSDDLRIERSEVPKEVNIWLTYSRTVTVPLLGQQRQVVFNDHALQDLSPVKW
jgi:hypothetical protein